VREQNPDASSKVIASSRLDPIIATTTALIMSDDDCIAARPLSRQPHRRQPFSKL
jgi:hypothetical protein